MIMFKTNLSVSSPIHWSWAPPWSKDWQAPAALPSSAPSQEFKFSHFGLIPCNVSLVTELPSQAVCVIDFLFYFVSLYHSGPHYNLRSILHHFTFAQFDIIIQAAITFGQLWAIFGFDENSFTVKLSLSQVAMKSSIWTSFLDLFHILYCIFNRFCLPCWSFDIFCNLSHLKWNSFESLKAETWWQLVPLKYPSVDQASDPHIIQSRNPQWDLDREVIRRALTATWLHRTTT